MWAFESVSFFNRQSDPRPIKSLLCWIFFTLLPFVKNCFTDVNRDFTIEMNYSRNVFSRIQFYRMCHLIVKLQFSVIKKKIKRLRSPERNSTIFQFNHFQIKLQIQKPLIVNFKIRNSQKFQSIVSFFLGNIKRRHDSRLIRHI